MSEHFCLGKRIAETGVSEINRQMGQELLHLLAFAIPGNETNDRKSVAEIMRLLLTLFLLDEDFRLLSGDCSACRHGNKG